MRRNSGKRANSGFSLIEMMLVVLILGIAFGSASPIFEVIQSKGVEYQAVRLTSAINYARTEAIKRKARVNICGSSSGTVCDAALGGQFVWFGWFIYEDVNDDGAFNTGDVQLKIFPPKKNFPVTVYSNIHISMDRYGMSLVANDAWTLVLSTTIILVVCAPGNEDVYFRLQDRSMLRGRVGFDFC